MKLFKVLQGRSTAISIPDHARSSGGEIRTHEPRSVGTRIHCTGTATPRFSKLEMGRTAGADPGKRQSKNKDGPTSSLAELAPSEATVASLNIDPSARDSSPSGISRSVSRLRCVHHLGEWRNPSHIVLGRVAKTANVNAGAKVAMDDRDSLDHAPSTQRVSVTATCTQFSGARSLRAPSTPCCWSSNSVCGCAAPAT